MSIHKLPDLTRWASEGGWNLMFDELGQLRYMIGNPEFCK
jgi:hypothetical protein